MAGSTAGKTLASKLRPRAIIDWEKSERIIRHKEIWDDKDSIVHRLPLHYQRNYWKNYVLADRAPVHYDPPAERFWYDDKRNEWRESQVCFLQFRSLRAVCERFVSLRELTIFKQV